MRHQLLIALALRHDTGDLHWLFTNTNDATGANNATCATCATCANNNGGRGANNATCAICAICASDAISTYANRPFRPRPPARMWRWHARLMRPGKSSQLLLYSSH